MRVSGLRALTCCLGMAAAALAQPVPTAPRTIPFSELGLEVPLTLRLPSDYIHVKRFQPMGVIVLCAQADEVHLKDNGDFSGARRAVITLRPSASDHYDPARKVFSFESPEAQTKLKAAGAKNPTLEKWEVRGVPLAAMTFEIGSRKVYSLALAAGPVLYRLSYNARSEAREVDDRLWTALVAGL